MGFTPLSLIPPQLKMFTPVLGLRGQNVTSVLPTCSPRFRCVELTETPEVELAIFFDSTKEKPHRAQLERGLAVSKLFLGSADKRQSSKRAHEFINDRNFWQRADCRKLGSLDVAVISKFMDSPIPLALPDPRRKSCCPCPWCAPALLGRPG